MDTEKIQSIYSNILSSKLSYMFRLNLVIIRLATGKKGQAYTEMSIPLQLSSYLSFSCDQPDADQVWSKHVQCLKVFTVTTNSRVNSFIYMTTSFDPKLGSSSRHNKREWNIH
jgi:hypothetical protein